MADGAEIMRRDEPTTPFDVEADDLTQEFWGASKGWVSSEHPSVRRRPEHVPAEPRDTTGSIRAIRDGLAAFRPQTDPDATGRIARQRRHGEVRRHGEQRRRDEAVADRREATLGELAAGRSDVGGWYDDPLPTRDGADHPLPEHDVPLTPVQPLVERLGLGAVDPLLVRAGGVIVAVLLLVPFVLALRPDRADSLPGGEVVDAPVPAAGAAPAEPVTQVVATEPTVIAATASPAAPSSAPATDPAAPAAPEQASASTSTVAGDRELVESAAPVETAPPSAQLSAAAAVDAEAERLVPDCPQTYTAAPGDSWYRIADAAGITPGELLAENNATLDTVILPGDEICLTADATVPAPPATTAPPTTAPTTTETPTTTAPATTTTTVAPTANLSRSEVQDLIRQTWPADEVDKALAIARRESNFIATADNGWCCVGIFQIYWTVHQTWLGDFGIHQRSDLYDARKNVAAAFHMWQSQGWGPWGG